MKNYKQNPKEDYHFYSNELSLFSHPSIAYMNLKYFNDLGRQGLDLPKTFKDINKKHYKYWFSISYPKVNKHINEILKELENNFDLIIFKSTNYYTKNLQETI